MIVVHVNKSWPFVQEARMDEAEAVLGVWPIAEDKLAAYGDVLLAVFDNTVVAAYDIEDRRPGLIWWASPTPARIGAARGMPGRCAMSILPSSQVATSPSRAPTRAAGPSSTASRSWSVPTSTPR
jgi:hypothetical protein